MASFAQTAEIKFIQDLIFYFWVQFIDFSNITFGNDVMKSQTVDCGATDATLVFPPDLLRLILKNLFHFFYRNKSFIRDQFVGGLVVTIPVFAGSFLRILEESTFTVSVWA